MGGISFYLFFVLTITGVFLMFYYNQVLALSGTLGFVWAGWGQAELPPLSTGFVYWPAFAGIVLTSMLLAPVGARLAHSLPVQVLKRVFALLLLAVGVKLLLG